MLDKQIRGIAYFISFSIEQCTAVSIYTTLRAISLLNYDK